MRDAPPRPSAARASGRWQAGAAQLRHPATSAAIRAAVAICHAAASRRRPHPRVGEQPRTKERPAATFPGGTRGFAGAPSGSGEAGRWVGEPFPRAA